MYISLKKKTLLNDHVYIEVKSACKFYMDSERGFSQQWMWSNNGTGNGKPRAEWLHNTLGGEDKLPVLHFTQMLLCGGEKEKDLNIQFCPSIGL